MPQPELKIDKPAVERERVLYPDLKVTSNDMCRPDIEHNSVPSIVDCARPKRTTNPPDRLGYDKLGGQ